MSGKEELYRAASDASLENAGQFLSDARTLLESGSCGHALALAVYGGEETAKAYICWLVSNNVIPTTSQVARGAFKKHKVKYGMEYGLSLAFLILEGFKSGKLTPEGLVYQLQKTPSIELFRVRKTVEGRERMRQQSLYVNFDDSGGIISPLFVTIQDAEKVISEVESRFTIVNEWLKEEDPDRVRALLKLFASVPEKAWESGEIELELDFSRFGRTSPEGEEDSQDD